MCFHLSQKCWSLSLTSISLFRRWWVHWVWHNSWKPGGDWRRGGHFWHRLCQEQRPTRSEAVQHLQHAGSGLLPTDVPDCVWWRPHGRREDLGVADVPGLNFAACCKSFWNSIGDWCIYFCPAPFKNMFDCQDVFETKDEIEEVNRKLLEKLLDENEFVAVYFCKFSFHRSLIKESTKKSC